VHSIIKGLRVLHAAEVIHRDMKPSNILIDRDCRVKIADFSLARYIGGMDKDQGIIMSDYVAARWYRAPEILLGSSRYDEKADMWGLGCIIAELYLNRPLFPGSSTLNQVSRIIEITGKPEAEDLAEIHSPVARTMFENLKLDRGPPKDIRDVVSMADTDDPEAYDLMEKLLCFRPSERISAEEAFRHPYVD
jgi:mitogen-activated protein kinase 15